MDRGTNRQVGRGCGVGRSAAITAFGRSSTAVLPVKSGRLPRRAPGSLAPSHAPTCGRPLPLLYSSLPAVHKQNLR